MVPGFAALIPGYNPGDTVLMVPGFAALIPGYNLGDTGWC
jgi:hypothetical protein